LRDDRVPQLSRGRGHGRERSLRSRSHAPDEPPYDRFRRGREHAGESPPVDPEPRLHQARLTDAGHERRRRRPGCARGLHGVASLERSENAMSFDAVAIPDVRIESPPWTEVLHEWVTTVDHKRIGLLYITYALMFLVVAGSEALIMRIHLMYPHNDFVSPQVFNRMFTMHGTTMIFFVAIPILFGFANYLVPLMIGARDMAFPRLNAFSFWLTALGGLLIYFSFLGGSGLYGAGIAPDVGWWAYAPLAMRAFSPGNSSDYWTIAVLVAGFGTIGASINIIATVLSMRCSGMTLTRMPLLVWLNSVMAGMVLIVVTPLSAAQIMLLIDRYLGGHFFDTQAGGSATLWMHFFWIFGHPEVYVLI